MIRTALRPHAIFSESRDRELARTQEMMNLLRLPAGTEFIVQGERIDNDSGQAFIVTAGEVRVVRKDARGEKLVEVVVGPGSILGVAALVLDHGRTATCTAESDVRLIELNRSQFHPLFESDNRLAVRFKHVIARQLAQSLRRANQAAAGQVQK